MDAKIVLALLILELLPAYGVWHVFRARPETLFVRRRWVRGGKALFLVISLPLLLALSLVSGSEWWWLHATAGLMLAVVAVSNRRFIKVWYAAAWRRIDNWHHHHAIAVIRTFAQLGWQIDVEKTEPPTKRNAPENNYFRLRLGKGNKRIMLERALGKGSLHTLFWLVCRLPYGTSPTNSDAPDPAEYLLVVSHVAGDGFSVEKLKR